MDSFLKASRERSSTSLSGIATSSLREMDSFLQAFREIDTSLLRRIDTSSLR